VSSPINGSAGSPAATEPRVSGIRSY
jgi:hypothetical protein